MAGEPENSFYLFLCGAHNTQNCGENCKSPISLIKNLTAKYKITIKYILWEYLRGSSGLKNIIFGLNLILSDSWRKHLSNVGKAWIEIKVEGAGIFLQQRTCISRKTQSILISNH